MALLRKHLGVVAMVTTLVSGLALLACGGAQKGKPLALGGADAGIEGGRSVFATTPPPSGLPPMATMPPPGVQGSKRAKLKPDATLRACVTTDGRAKDPAAALRQLGESCASASKMKPLGAPIRGQQGDKDPHQENKFRAEGNHCYRVYVATEESALDLVVVLRDSAGDIIAESKGPAIPEEGSVCFTTSDEVTMMIGVGSGKGAWVAQVYQD